MSSRIWRRSAAATLAGAAVVTGLVAVAAPTASAQPAEPTTPVEPAAMMSADQALMIIASEYDLGSGGGQLSKLIDQVMRLRSQGVRPSMASRQMIVAALDDRPNQTPLIEALQATLIDQRTQVSRRGVQAAAPGAPAPATPGSPHSTMGPNWGPGNPMQQDTPIFQMPGR